jgi:hypothetical protein
VAVERRNLLEVAANKVRELERQITDLQERLRERETERAEAAAHLQEMDAKVNELQKQAETDRLNLRNNKDRLRERQQDRERAVIRRKEAYRQSIFQFLEGVEKSLTTLALATQQRQSKAASLDAFKKARHNDHVVANLCDARDEWRSVLKTVAVPAVQETASAELAKIESEIERRFPGALELEEGARPEERIEDLFFVRQKTTGEIRLFVPLSRKAWDSLSKEDGGVLQQTAMHLLWTLIQSLGLRTESARIRADSFWTITISGNVAEEAQKREITMTLPGGGSVIFILSPLPSEIEEAITDETFAT